MTLLSALAEAAGKGKLLILWGSLPFPLETRPPTNRALALNRLAEVCRALRDVAALPALPPLPILSLDASPQVEQAFAEAGLALQVMRTRRDVPARDRHNLLKLAGDLATRSGVVLSQSEVRTLHSDADKRYLLDEARRIAKDGALLLLGCDPASVDFQAWWAALAPTFPGAALFAVGEPSAPWPEGVTCLEEDLETASSALRAALPPRALKPPTGQAITWLHLSDLHFRQATAYDENIVLRALLVDVAERGEQEDLRPDFVVVSGDIAFSGQAAEYAMAERFFDDLLATSALGKDRLFLVPGNHDVDRGAISPLAAAAPDILKNRQAANAFLANDADRARVFERFHSYCDFVNGYLAPNLVFDDTDYFYVKQIRIAEQQIAILGLNSAWLAASDADRNRLLLGERQVRAALDAAAGADLRVAVMHHPFDWLQDFDRVDAEALLCDGCDFVLHGHMHQVGLLQARGPDSNAFIFAAGACYETREYPNAYNLVRLELGSGRGAIHLRMYSDRRGGFWTQDALNYRNVPDGVYEFCLKD
jgi:predicted phosphodiesterase